MVKNCPTPPAPAKGSTLGSRQLRPSGWAGVPAGTHTRRALRRGAAQTQAVRLSALFVMVT